jgi:hypothetical protein
MMLGDREYDYINGCWLDEEPQNRNAVCWDEDWDNERYREFQEANFNEYFDFAATYRYALYK